MFINFIELENWKCFSKKKKFCFEQHQLISLPNGRGKTSLFEAIMFVIWGKAPVGFDLNTVRTDDSKNCRIFVDFDLNINNKISHATIERIFGKQTLAELKIDDKLICESVRTIKDFMNEILNEDIVKQLWTQSLIDSQILKADFFTTSILKDVLSDPLNLLSFYKKQNYNLNKVVNNFDSSNLLSIEEIEKELNDIKLKIKNNNGITNSEVSKANAAKLASEICEKLNNKVISLKEKGLDLEKSKEYLILNKKKDSIKEKLNEELQKVDSIFSSFDSSEILKILNKNEEKGCCIFCNSKFTKEDAEKIRKEIKGSGRSEKVISSLKENLNLLNSFSLEEVNCFIQYYDNKTIADSLPNFNEILANYDEENNKLWERFDNLQKKMNIAIEQQNELSRINELKTKIAENKEKIDVISKYIEEASNYYNNELLNKASDHLKAINGRYHQVCIFEGSFNIVVEDEDLVLHLLPVVRLSKGEQTMVALSLLFAIHNILVPETPLLFDETFSSLDKENLLQVQKFLRKQNNTQIFVITHDQTWTEF